jgi:hypothetical protein
MTPEIRAAVKTLAAAFQTILEALAAQETPTPAPPPGHPAHLVHSRFGGMDFCCAAHEEQFGSLAPTRV